MLTVAKEQEEEDVSEEVEREMDVANARYWVSALRILFLSVDVWLLQGPVTISTGESATYANDTTDNAFQHLSYRATVTARSAVHDP
jgi:hypothetical protein